MSHSYITNRIRFIMDNIYVNKLNNNNMSKSIVKSIKQTDYSTIITTKSGIVKVFKFNTIKENNEFYNSQM